MNEPISIEGLSKAAVLAALYNRASPKGLGMLHFTPVDMTEVEAQKLLDEGQDYFDYLNGRVIKVSLEKNEFRPGLYDRDNGTGAAAEVINTLREAAEK